MGNWFTDKIKLNLSLISKRLTEVPEGGMGDDLVFSIPSELSTQDVDKKGNNFFMIPSQSVLHGGLRFPLKKFFRNVLAELGVALGQLFATAWRIMKTLYISCHATRKVECLDAASFFTFLFHPSY